MDSEPIGASLRSLRSAFAGVAALGLPINLLMLTGPLFMLQIYDRVLVSGSVPTLVVLGGLTAGLFVFYGLLEGTRSRVLLRISQRFDTQLSAAAFDCSVSLPQMIGRAALRYDPIGDLEAVRRFLAGPGPAAIFDIPWMPFYLGVIYLFHPVLGFAAAGGVFVICILVGLNELFSRRPATIARRLDMQRSATAEEGRSNGEVIAAMGMMDALKERWSLSNGDRLDKQRWAGDRANLFSTIIKTFRFLLQSAILGIGAWLVIAHEITPGIMIAASIMASRTLAPVEQAVGQWRNFVTARQGLRRLKEALEIRGDESERMALPLPGKSLDVQNLVSGPPGHTLLKDVSFSLGAGEGLGIIGPSGAGKTTLARVLVGVYPVVRGSLRLDQSDLCQWSCRQRGAFIGYLPQDIQLFSGTVAQNIARFASGAVAKDIIQAARLADAHALISALPDGYNTKIGARSSDLSRGQVQRIALARALFGDPFLVVLDEPNSNLDSKGEAALTSAVRTMRDRGSIVIVVAHRPNVLAGVDNILLMENGRVRRFGPKEDVFKQVLAPVPGSVVAAQ